VSECIASSDKDVVGRKNGRSGLIFTTGDIKWVPPTQAEISGGYYEGNMSASGNTYYRDKIDGKWRVIKVVVRWIS